MKSSTVVQWAAFQSAVREKVSWNRPSPLTSAATRSLVSASAPLTWVQWLSGKSIRLAFGRSQVRIPVRYQTFLWISFSLLSPISISMHDTVAFTLIIAM